MKKVLAVIITWYLALWSVLLGHNPPLTKIILVTYEKKELVWNKTTLQAHAKELMTIHYPTWNSSEYRALKKLWGKESAWDHTADNPNSSAFGVPQLLNLDPTTPAPLQVERGLAYIEHRYGKPSTAWSHWRKHGWY